MQFECGTRILRVIHGRDARATPSNGITTLLGKTSAKLSARERVGYHRVPIIRRGSIIGNAAVLKTAARKGLQVRVLSPPPIRFSKRLRPFSIADLTEWRLLSMPVPDFQRLMLPLLKLAADGQPHTLVETVEQLAQEFKLSDEDRGQLLRSGQTRLYNRVGWSTTYLKKAGLVQAVGLGRFQITDRGQAVLAGQPAAIDVAFLESRFPEMWEFRKSRSKRESADEESAAIFNTVEGAAITGVRVPPLNKGVKEGRVVAPNYPGFYFIS